MATCSSNLMQKLRLCDCFASGHWRGLIPAFTVGYILRLVWMVYAHPAPVTSDSAVYYDLAMNMLDHGAFALRGEAGLIPHAYFLPGYPFFLACCGLVSCSYAWMAYVNVLLSAILIPLVGLLALRMFPRIPKMSVLAAWLVALNPGFIGMAPMVASENLFAPLLVGVLLMCWRGAGRFRATAGGLLMGAAFLCRGEAVFQLPAVGFLFLPFDRPRKWFRALLCAGLLGLAFVASVTPWLWRNQNVVGKPMISATPGLNFFLAHNNENYGWMPHSRLLEILRDAGERQKKEFVYGSPDADAYFMTRGVAYVRESLANKPSRLARDLLTGTLRHFAPSRTITGTQQWVWASYTRVVFWCAMLCLAAYACCFWRRIPIRSLLLLLLLGFMNWFCFAVIFWTSHRYRMVTELAVSVLAAYGIFLLGARGSVRQQDAAIGRTEKQNVGA